MPAPVNGLSSLFREHALFVALLVLIVPVYLFWTASDQLGHSGGDGAFYLMMANAYSPFGTHDVAYAKAASIARFPPLYPAWLIVTGAAHDLLLTHWSTVLSLFLALIAIYAWLLGEGATSQQAAGVAGLVAVLPQTCLLGLWPQSEYLYLLTSVLCIVALGRYAKSPTLGWALGSALAAAAAMLTRTIGIALLPAAAMVFLLGPRKRDVWTILVALAPTLIWGGLHPSPTSYVTILKVSYGDGFWPRLLWQLSNQPELLRYGFAGNFLQTIGLMGIASTLAVVVALVLIWQALRLRAAALYCAVYLGIVAIWPFPEEIARLLWPIVPLLIGGLVTAAARLGAKVSPLMRHVAGGAVIAALLALTLPTLAFFVDRWLLAANEPHEFRRLPEWYVLDPHRALEMSRVQVAVAHAFSRLAELVPPDDCVISIKPELAAYYGHRVSVTPPLGSTPDAMFEAQLKGTGCHHVLMVGSKDPTFPRALYPYERIKGRITILEREVAENPDRNYDFLVAVIARLSDLPEVEPAQ